MTPRRLLAIRLRRVRHLSLSLWREVRVNGAGPASTQRRLLLDKAVARLTALIAGDSPEPCAVTAVVRARLSVLALSDQLDAMVLTRASSSPANDTSNQG